MKFRMLTGVADNMTICVAGASGYVGSACSDVLSVQGCQVSGFSRRGGITPSGLQVATCRYGGEFQELIRKMQPDVFLVASGIADLDFCERSPEQSLQTNVEAFSEWLTTLSLISPDSVVVLISSIYVFGDHCPSEGFCETDVPRPVSVYGRHKLQAEQILQASGLRHLIVRLPWLIGNVSHKLDPVVQLWNNLLRGQTAFDDGMRFPTDVDWVARCIYSMICIGAEGIVHLSAAVPGSRLNLIASLNHSRNISRPPTLLRKVTCSITSTDARSLRPKYLRLVSCRPEVQRLQACPTWDHVMVKYANYLNGTPVSFNEQLPAGLTTSV